MYLPIYVYVYLFNCVCIIYIHVIFLGVDLFALVWSMYLLNSICIHHTYSTLCGHWWSGTISRCPDYSKLSGVDTLSSFCWLASSSSSLSRGMHGEIPCF